MGQRDGKLPAAKAAAAPRHASDFTIVPALVLATAMASAGCTPTVKIATDEPITINLNVNIKHEILVKVDRELDSLFGKDSELF